MSEPKTIPEALFATAGRGAGEYLFHLEDGIVRFSCEELAERAARAARRLWALGVEPGDAVGVLGPNRPEWMVSAFAIWIAGAALVPLQIPVRVRDSKAFEEQLQRLISAGRCRRVLADPALLALVPAGTAVPWDDSGEESSEERPPASPRDAAVIQFTSGSTAAPKGALLTHRAVSAQMEALRRGCRYADGTFRSMLSWTPFFHDLGLFASLVQPAFSAASVHQLPTERFAADPVEWLRLIDLTRAALTVGPSSAFGSAIRAAGRRGEQIDLSSLEVTYFAAEGVDPDVARRMVESATDLGFRPEALGSTYGLAEAVMAVSYPYPGTGLRVDRVSLDLLASSAAAVPASTGSLRSVASCGPPLMELRIWGPEGRPLPERYVGEIQVRGASLMSRYVGADASHPFAPDGWLSTGDLGYLAEGDLYVTGRAKDMMIANGHNYYPEDFEWAAARVAGVRPGRCVAFGLPDGDAVVVLAEAEDGRSPAFVREVSRAISDAVGVRPGEVIVLPPGTIEKTTSGKLRRTAMRRRYLAGELRDAVS